VKKDLTPAQMFAEAQEALPGCLPCLPCGDQFFHEKKVVTLVYHPVAFIGTFGYLSKYASYYWTAHLEDWESESSHQETAEKAIQNLKEVMEETVQLLTRRIGEIF